jgi:hypothetical protein
MRFSFQRLTTSWVRLLWNLAESSITVVKVGSFLIESTDRMFLAFCSFKAQKHRPDSDIVMGLENVAKQNFSYKITSFCGLAIFQINALRFCNLNLFTQYHHHWEKRENNIYFQIPAGRQPWVSSKQFKLKCKMPAGDSNSLLLLMRTNSSRWCSLKYFTSTFAQKLIYKICSTQN